MAVLRQFGRFGAIGILATVVHVAAVVILVESGALRPIWANLIAFCVALMVSYAGNHQWTFRAVSRHAHYFPRFAAISLTGLLLNQAIVYVGTELLRLDYLWALAVVVLVIPILSFAASRWWAFAAPAPGESPR